MTIILLEQLQLYVCVSERERGRGLRIEEEGLLSEDQDGPYSKHR